MVTAHSAPLGNGNPQCRGSQVGGTGNRAQPVVAAHGAPVGNGSPQWCGVTGSGNGESSAAGGRSSNCACAG